MTAIALLVMTDGRRQYIKHAIDSASCKLIGSIGPRFMFDDSGDAENHQWLRDNFPDFDLIYKETRQGFGGAINSAWDYIKKYDFDYVFHLEDDFTFNRGIPLEDMAQVLKDNPHVYQMALCRQAWNHEEREAGGVIQRWSSDLHQQDGWISHRLWFTTNPSLYRKSLIETREYPNVKDSEGHFSQSIITSDPAALFGYWGQKTDPPWVEHIGIQRKGNIY